MSILDDEDVLINDLISTDIIEPIVTKILRKEHLDESEKQTLNNCNYVGLYKFNSNDEFEQFINIIAGNTNYISLNLNWIDTSEVTTMSYLFRNSYFNGDISKWNTSNVTGMVEMFLHSRFNGDISNWDTRNVKLMSRMFSGSRFNGDISNWDTRNVVCMDRMFSGSQFNGDISNWDTHNVRTMSYMFSNSRFNQDISKWNVSRVENMSGMFYESCFDGDISNWDVFNVTCVTDMFDHSLFSGDISKWVFGKILGGTHTLSDITCGKYNYMDYINQQYINEYDKMVLDGEYILSKLLNVDCSDNFSIIENVRRIEDMMSILEMSTKLMKVKGVARLYNIPESFIEHVVKEDGQINTNNINVSDMSETIKTIKHYFKTYDKYDKYSDEKISRLYI